MYPWTYGKLAIYENWPLWNLMMPWYLWIFCLGEMGFFYFARTYIKKHFYWFQAGITDPPEMSPALIAEKEKQRKFLEQLMDGSKLEGYNIVVPVKAELRKYQQVRWSDNAK